MQSFRDIMQECRAKAIVCGCCELLHDPDCYIEA